MASIKFTWPHDMSVKITDPDTCRDAFKSQINDLLGDKKHFNIVMSDRTIIIPKALVQTAVIEITDK